MKIKLIFLILIIGISSVSSQSLDKELKVVKDYSDQIYSVNPLFEYQSIKVPLTTINRERNRRDTLVQLGTYSPNVDVTIKPLVYEADQAPKLYNGFIKVDQGTVNPLGVSGSYVHSVDNYFNIESAIHYDHWNETSTQNKSVEEIKGAMAFKYYVNDEVLSTLRVEVSESKYGIYGFGLPKFSEQKSSVDYSRFGVQFKLATFRPGASYWNYDGALDFTRTALHKDEINENSFHARAALQRNVSSVLAFKVEISGKNSSLSFTDNINKFRLTMTSEIRSKKWFGALGGSINSYDHKRTVFPFVDIKYQVSKEMNFFARADERIIFYGLNRLSQINPYISKEYAVSFASRNKEIQIGVVAPLTQTARIRLATSVSRRRNAPVFRTPDLRDNRFIVEHVNYDLIRLEIDVSKDITDHFKTNVNLDYTYYTNESSSLYHLPKLQVEPSVQWNSRDQNISFKIKGRFQDQTLLFDDGLVKKKSNYRKDISLEISYGLLKRVDIYLNVDNVLNDQFEVWNGYDVFERNISGGILVRI